MATKNSALRNKMADDFGSLWNSGTMTIKASDGTVLATFNLPVSAFGSASSGKITLSGVPISAVAGATGTAAKADFVSSNSTYKLEDLTVGTSASQVVIDNTSINSGQTVNLVSFTWEEPATIED